MKNANPKATKPIKTEYKQLNKSVQIFYKKLNKKQIRQYKYSI
mgnify:CR=1 FL=1